MKLHRILIATLATAACLLGANASAQENSLPFPRPPDRQSACLATSCRYSRRKAASRSWSVALGTGQALDTARRGDADVVFVHDKAAEEKFIAEGWGVERKEVMYNDFILIGPKADPAKTAGKDILEGLRRIAGVDAATRPPFVSRGDKSGTHAAELRYWQAPASTRQAKGPLSRPGSGMGPALNTLLDDFHTCRPRTCSPSRPRQAGGAVEGDTRVNPSGVILVNPPTPTSRRRRRASRLAGFAERAETIASTSGGSNCSSPIPLSTLLSKRCESPVATIWPSCRCRRNDLYQVLQVAIERTVDLGLRTDA